MEPLSGSEPSAASLPVLRAADPETVLFASDMHLHESDPALAERFFRRLDEVLTRALGGTEPPALFLLGDLFEYWVGDDQVSDLAQTLADRLAAFAGRGGRVFLMHGNRDFLVDVPVPSKPGLEKYSTRCDAILLADPAVIEIGGRRIALSHGDALCTEDARYQQWRALCRSSAWQQEFLSRPVAERLALAQGLRKQSVDSQAAATETIYDVNNRAVDALMTRLDVGLLIHGHTHQPALHRWHTADRLSGPGMIRTRWVLSDWGVAPPRGSILTVCAATPPAC